MTRVGLTRTLSALNAEWERLADAPVPRDWLVAIPGARTPGAVLRLAPDSPDAVLLALLSLLRLGDDLAGRVVVQAMVPKLVLMAARDEEATFDDYLAALWVRVATYPVERRPRRVAANLALDTLKTVTTGRRRVPQPGLPVAVPDPLGDAVTVLDAGVRLGAIDPLTRRTLEVVYVEGRTSSAAGRVLGMSADAVRWRCSKGVRALRRLAPDLIDQLAG